MTDNKNKWFHEGLIAAQGGLSRETCPYEVNQGSMRDGVPRPNWIQGWAFGHFLNVQHNREHLQDQIIFSIKEILNKQNEYSKYMSIWNLGFFKTGFKYFEGKRKGRELIFGIMKSKEYLLLKELYITVYLPTRPSEAPYTIQFFDHQLKAFGDYTEAPFRRIVSQYDDKFEVRQAWTKYVKSDNIESTVARIREEMVKTKEN